MQTRNSKGIGLYSPNRPIETGAHPDYIIGKAQEQIKAAMPQEVDDVNGRKANEAWLVSSEGQARRVAERVAEDSGRIGRQARDSRSGTESALSTLDRAERQPVKNAGRFLDPEAQRLKEYDDRADRIGLTPEQKKAFTPSTRRDDLTKFFTLKELDPTIERARQLS